MDLLATELKPELVKTQQDLFCLNVSDGRIPFIIPHVQALTNPGAVFPPGVDAEGRIVIPWAYLYHHLARIEKVVRL